MRGLSVTTQLALAARNLAPRDFLWIRARDRDTGDAVEQAFWSDFGTLTANVDVRGTVYSRTYHGVGALVGVSEIAAMTGAAVQSVDVTLSQISPQAEAMVRGHDVSLAPVQIHRGYLDPRSGLLSDTAILLFEGRVDDLEILTPAEGEAGAIRLTVANYSQDLGRSSSALRSGPDQRRRQVGDGFYDDAARVGRWTVKWGQA